MKEILPDIPRIYTAVAEWAACLLQIVFMKKRIKGLRLAVVCAVWLAVQSGFLILTDNVPEAFWLLCMLFAVALMFLFLFLCCREKITELLCGCIKAFLLAEFAASFEWQIHYFILNASENGSIPEPVLFAAIYLAVFLIAYVLEKRLWHTDKKRTRTVREMECMLLIASIAFLFSNISFTSIVSPFSGEVVTDIFYIRTLADLAGLVILYAYQGYLNELYIREELANIDRLYKSQYKNYLYFQECMDVINIRYHDLKHQMNVLRAQSGEGRTEWIDALEKEIEENNIFLNTGSSVLDTVLSEKMLLCKKEEIDLTCMADGSLLCFMQPADLCSVFGNALDNAIENVRLTEDKEKRLICVNVTRSKGCIYILIENYTESVRKLSGDLAEIQSTKPDKGSHGYGLKSIKRTVEKYGGTCTAAIEEHWFRLRILFDAEKTRA